MDAMKYSDTQAQYRNKRTGARYYCQQIPRGLPNFGMLLAFPVERSPNTPARLLTIEEFEARFQAC